MCPAEELSKKAKKRRKQLDKMSIADMVQKEKEDAELDADDEAGERDDPKGAKMVQEGEEGFYVIDGDEPWLDNGNRNLKKEAKSLRHQILHNGFNPHCQCCK